jgi:Predicted membrane protein (DUF2306)
LAQLYTVKEIAMRQYRWGFVAFAGFSLLISLMSLRILVLPFDLVMVNMAHFVAEKPLSLWGHVLGAPLALALAPLQLWSGLKMRWPGLHRWSGRLYGVAVLIGGIGGLTLAPTSVATEFARAGFMVLALAWLGSTGFGIGMAMRGDYARHRIWMQRSLALTFSAVTLRLIMGPLMAMGWSVPDTYDVTAWGSWILNLVVLEIWRARRAAGRAAQRA